MIQQEHILTVSIVQPNLIWESPEENYTLLESSVKSITATDLIVLPEMFSTGFSMQPEKFYETMEGKGVEWMLQLADKTKAVITGSLIIKENEKFYNRLLWVTPEGAIHSYDKRHLFSFAGEDKQYSSGDSRLIVELKGWKICPLICYDLRFPVWSRNQNLTGRFADSEYDMLIYVANWPEARSSAWKTLLSARAHENQTFVVGVNRVGKDGNQINHSGDSCIISPKGELIESIQPNKASVATSELNLKELREFRTKFGAWRDKDQFEIK